MELKIVCIGDSITYGYPYNPETSWVNLASSATKIKMVNKGVNGDTTGAMSYRFKTDIIPENPTHIIIMGGTNDAYTNETLERVGDNIQTMARKAIALKINPIIALPVPARVNYLEINLHKYRFWMINYTKKNNLNFIDFNQALLDKQGKPMQNLFFDDVHPNKQGYKVMSEIVIDFLSNLIIS